MSVEDIIKQKLEAEFSPHYLRVENESHKHAGHAGSPGTGESHFKVEISASKLEGLGRVNAHRRVNECLAEELKTKVHALSLRVVAKLEIQNN